jgi:Sigma-70, region 4
VELLGPRHRLALFAFTKDRPKPRIEFEPEIDEVGTLGGRPCGLVSVRVANRRRYAFRFVGRVAGYGQAELAFLDSARPLLTRAQPSRVHNSVAGRVIAFQVGRTLGVTRERIRQIENGTLKKLASLPEAQRLNDCI